MYQEFVVLLPTVPPVKYRSALTVNHTAGTLGTRKTELDYANISLCSDIVKTHMLCIVLALVIVGHSDHFFIFFVLFIYLFIFHFVIKIQCNFTICGL